MNKSVALAVVSCLFLLGASGDCRAAESKPSISSQMLEQMGLLTLTTLSDEAGNAIRGTGDEHGKGYGIGALVSAAAKSGKHGQELADYVHSLLDARPAKHPHHKSKKAKKPKKH
jgi:hypothetical protein